MTYAIVHFWPARGGFGRRIDMLAAVLAERGRVLRIGTPGAFWRLVRSSDFRRGQVSLLVYTSLLAVLVAAVRLARPLATVYYMVRGDEVTWALHGNRRWRAVAARFLQRLLVSTGCNFVFASEDLRETFESRLGSIRRASILPNTLGRPLPTIRPFDGRVAAVGDFGTVKNVEAVIAGLSDGDFRLDLFGNTGLPQRWSRPWVTSHGIVGNLVERLRECSLIVLAGVSEGFPNVLTDALEAGCGVVVHDGFPFRRLPIAEPWRFRLDPSGGDLAAVLTRLRADRRDFARDNPALLRLVASDWSRRVWDVFAA